DGECDQGQNAEGRLPRHWIESILLSTDNRSMLWLLAIAFAISVPAAGNAAVGSQACFGCHADIYRKYMATGMALSSGRVGSGDFAERPTAASFDDAQTGATYRVTRMKDSYRMEFSRLSAGVKGERDLRWFIGSGRVGRSYVFSLDGFLFQAPVSYYSS